MWHDLPRKFRRGGGGGGGGGGGDMKNIEKKWFAGPKKTK